MTEPAASRAAGSVRRRRRPRARSAHGTLTGAGRHPDRELRRERVVRQRLPRRGHGHRPGARRAARRPAQPSPARSRSPAGTSSAGGRLAHVRQRRLPLHLVPGRRPTRRARCASTCCDPRELDRPPLRAHREDTIVNTLQPRRRAASTPARRARARTTQVRRVQRNPALLRAVAARDPAATEAAIEGAAQPAHRAPARRAPAGSCCPTSAARTCSRPCTPRCASAGARSAASCSRSRTTRATCAWPGAWRASTCSCTWRLGHELVKNSLGAGPPRGGARQRHLPLPRAQLPRVHAPRQGVPLGAADDPRARPDPLL